jgi:hypothetical protein
MPKKCLDLNILSAREIKKMTVKNLLIFSTIVRVIKSRTACTTCSMHHGGITNEYRILVEKS